MAMWLETLLVVQDGDGDGHDNGNVTLSLLGYSLLPE
jgi:hypothetical protein